MNRPSVPTNSPPNRAHVLVAEDTPTILRLLGKVLTRAGYRVTLTKDGEEAIRTHAEQPDDFDLLILDIMLPKRTGEEVLDAVRLTSPGIAALFTTGLGEEALSQELRNNGVIEIVQKPWNSVTILEAVKNALDQKRNANP
ncbi:MAG: DNA-binding response OmpR family regulator [Planctomycetota bacterium]